MQSYKQSVFGVRLPLHHKFLQDLSHARHKPPYALSFEATQNRDVVKLAFCIAEAVQSKSFDPVP